MKQIPYGIDDFERFIAEACDQLNRYIVDKHLTASSLLRATPLTKLYLVFQGHHLITYGLH